MGLLTSFCEPEAGPHPEVGGAPILSRLLPRGRGSHERPLRNPLRPGDRVGREVFGELLAEPRAALPGHQGGLRARALEDPSDEVRPASRRRCGRRSNSCYFHRGDSPRRPAEMSLGVPSPVRNSEAANAGSLRVDRRREHECHAGSGDGASAGPLVEKLDPEFEVDFEDFSECTASSV